MKNLICITFLLLCFLHLSAQLVNIENQRMQTDSIRFAGNVNFLIDYTNNNNITLLQTSASLALQMKSKNLRNIFLILGSYDRAQAKNQDFDHNGFFHLRSTQKINDFIRWEAFGQVQFNYLLGIKQRLLFGTGPRMKIFKSNNHKAAYFGVMQMLEYEESSGEINVILRQLRLSSYLTLTFGFPKINAELTSTTYFQPRPDVFKDYRISTQTSMSFALQKHLRFTSGFSYYYDAFPPASFRGRAISIQQGIRYEF